jgi:hypothetical protein
MDRFEHQKILRDQVKLKKWLILDDEFLELSFERKIISREMLNGIMGTDFSSLDYCMKICRLGSQSFYSIYRYIVGTKQNDIVVFLLTTT